MQTSSSCIPAPDRNLTQRLPFQITPNRCEGFANRALWQGTKKNDVKLTGRDQTWARQRRGPTRRLGSRAHVKYSSSSPVGAETRRDEAGKGETRFWNHDGGMGVGVIRDCNAHVQRLPLPPCDCEMGSPMGGSWDDGRERKGRRQNPILMLAAVRLAVPGGYLPVWDNARCMVGGVGICRRAWKGM